MILDHCVCMLRDPDLNSVATAAAPYVQSFSVCNTIGSFAIAIPTAVHCVMVFSRKLERV